MLEIIFLCCLLPASPAYLDDLFLPKYVKLWLEEGTDLPGRCQDMYREGMEGNSVPFIKLSRCEDIPSNCEYIPYGKLDADGRLAGLSELVIHWIEGDSLEFRPEDVDEGDSPDTFCYSVSVPLSIRAVRAHFIRGLPQGRVSIKHGNGEETVGNCVDGVLHGVAVTKSREGTILFIGSYSLGRLDGWGWAFSPSDMDEHGALGFRAERGVVNWDGVVYLDMVRNKTLVGEYSEQSGTLRVDAGVKVSLDIKDCLAKASLTNFAGPTLTSSIELPFLVRISGNKVRVALKHLVVYNRLPKTSSQSFLHLLRSQ